jgi:hypothetical protein
VINKGLGRRIVRLVLVLGVGKLFIRGAFERFLYYSLVPLEGFRLS